MADVHAKVDKFVQKVKNKIITTPRAIVVIVGLAVVAFALVYSGALGS